MKKKATSVLKFVVLTLLFIFMTIYISDRNGYFVYSNYNKNKITEEGIKKFEEDVRNGKAIDVDTYIEKEADYSNNISNAALNVSNRVGTVIRKGIVGLFDSITNNIK